MINRGPNALPRRSREFRRTDRMLIRLEAYGPGNAVVAMTAKLLNKQGNQHDGHSRERRRPLPVRPA